MGNVDTAQDGDLTVGVGCWLRVESVDGPGSWFFEVSRAASEGWNRSQVELADAILGHRVGEVVEIGPPEARVRWRIAKIMPPTESAPAGEGG